MCGTMALAPVASQFGASAKTQNSGALGTNGLSNIKKLDYGSVAPLVRRYFVRHGNFGNRIYEHGNAPGQV